MLIDPVDGVGAARAFVESVHVHATTLIDPDGRVAAAYRVAAFPTTVFVGPDGAVVSSYPGQLSKAVLDAHLSNLSGG